MSTPIGTLDIPVWRTLLGSSSIETVDVYARVGALVAHEPHTAAEEGMVVSHEATGCRVCLARNLASAEALMAKLQQFPWEDLQLKAESFQRSQKAVLVTRPAWMADAKRIVRKHLRREGVN